MGSREHGEERCQPTKVSMKKFEILVDSDAFVGRFYTQDAHHRSSLELFAKYEERGTSLVTTSMVIAETATVLSHRSGQPIAREFLSIVERSELPIIHMDEDLQREALELFKAQETRGTSVVDCANVVVVRRFDIPKILSFDQFYFKRFHLKAA
jgi:predicted nucleic acid-binding protein